MRIMKGFSYLATGLFLTIVNCAGAFPVFTAGREVSSNHAPYVFPGPSGGICINLDSTGFFSRAAQLKLKTAADLEKYLDDFYLPENHQVREIMLNPNAARCSYRSRVRQAWWDEIDFTADGGAHFKGRPVERAHAAMVRAMKEFHEAGINPYQVWIAHLRKRGVSPWISMRMNDIHAAFEPDDPSHSDFWRNHPQWRLGSYRDTWAAQALDYGVAEVREYNLQLVEELLREFNADGLELDFMRFGRVFKAGEETAGRPLLTTMLRQIRALANHWSGERGHRIRIAVRVPPLPEDAFRLGYDVESWVRDGLIDMVIPTSFFTGTYQDIPLRSWRRLVGPDIILGGGIEANTVPYPGGNWFGGGNEFRFALATSFLHQGADRVYFFNHMSPREALWRHCGVLEHASAQKRRHAVFFNDFPAVGKRGDKPLPDIVRSGAWTAFTLNIGTGPESGRACSVILGSREDWPAGAVTEIRVNSIKLPETIPVPAALPFPPYIRTRTAFRIPAADVLHEGDNVIELKNSAAAPIRIDWVEFHLAPGRAIK